MQTDKADLRTPKAVREELGRFGGLNPYHRANWRVVLAETRLCLLGGVFTTLPSGDVRTFEIDPRTFEVHHRDVRPEKVETGYMEVPKWPVHGWILEKWLPASKYGSREAWESQKSSDGMTPMMGPYPHEGDYFMLGGPWEQIPEMEDLKCSISQHLRTQENNPVNYELFLRQEMAEKQAARDEKVRKYSEEVAHFYESEVEPVLRGTSLAAQRIRNDLQSAMGETSHLGVM